MSIPFALSLSKYVNSVGTDVGFASLLGVALLALLYFAGARESRTLRDQLEEAQERLATLEGRLTQALRNQAAAARQSTAPPAAAAPTQPPRLPNRPGVAAPPRVAAQAMGSTVARVEREAPRAMPGAAALAGAPAGAGAPSLGSSTKLIPDPVPLSRPLAPAAVPATVGAASLAAADAGEGDGDDFDDTFGPDSTMFVPAAATAGAGQGGGRAAAVAPPPRIGFADDDDDADEDDLDDGPPPRRTIPYADEEPAEGRRLAGRLLGALAAVGVVAAIVIVLLVVTSNNTSTAKRTRAQVATTAHRHTTPTAAAFNPAKVQVAVLNGTATSGLAKQVGDKLVAAGYAQGNFTNDASQTVTTTTVSYRPGYRSAATHVAAALQKATGVKIAAVTPADQATIASCAISPTGQTTTCTANVIVAVGADMVNAAGTPTTGT